MKIKKHINKTIDNKIIRLNDVLTKHLLEKTKNKKTLVDLSGGHDTRTNLSILLKNNMDITTYTRTQSKGDLPISKKIITKYKLPHIIKKETDGEEFKKRTLEEFDIKISGVGYTEALCALHELNRNFNTIVKIVKSIKNIGRYSPIIEKEAIDIVKEIPIVYLAGGIIQKRIIEINEPNLLNFPFTYYDLRHKLMNEYYIYFAKFVYKSYYTGKGRNLRDNKQTKDRL